MYFMRKNTCFYLLKLLNTIVIIRINTEISAIVPPGAQLNNMKKLVLK